MSPPLPEHSRRWWFVAVVAVVVGLAACVACSIRMLVVASGEGVAVREVTAAEVRDQLVETCRGGGCGRAVVAVDSRDGTHTVSWLAAGDDPRPLDAGEAAEAVDVRVVRGDVPDAPGRDWIAALDDAGVELRDGSAAAAVPATGDSWQATVAGPAFGFSAAGACILAVALPIGGTDLQWAWDRSCDPYADWRRRWRNRGRRLEMLAAAGADGRMGTEVAGLGLAVASVAAPAGGLAAVGGLWVPALFVAVPFLALGAAWVAVAGLGRRAERAAERREVLDRLAGQVPDLQVEAARWRWPESFAGVLAWVAHDRGLSDDGLAAARSLADGFSGTIGELVATADAVA